MRRPDPRLGRRPGDFRVAVAGIAQRRGGHQQPLRRRGQSGGERDGRVQPVPMQPDIQRRATRRGRSSCRNNTWPGRWPGSARRLGQAPQHRLPRLQRIQRPAGQRTADRLDPVAGGLVQFLRFVIQPGQQPFAQRGQRFGDAGQRPRQPVGRLGEHPRSAGTRRIPWSRLIRHARSAPRGARQDLAADQAQERFRRIGTARVRRRRVPGPPRCMRLAQSDGGKRAGGLQRGVQRSDQGGSIRHQVLQPLAAGRGRATAHPPRPAASGAVPRVSRPRARPRTRCRRRRTRGGPRRTRNGWARRCRPARPTPPGSSPERGSRPRVRRCGSGGSCAR